jgi:hypothetical protein
MTAAAACYLAAPPSPTTTNGAHWEGCASNAEPFSINARIDTRKASARPTQVRVQYGDDVGSLRPQQLPTQQQAAVIRDVLGIRKRVEFSTEDLERRRALMKRVALAAGRADATSPIPYQPSGQAPKISAEPAP